MTTLPAITKTGRNTTGSAGSKTTARSTPRKAKPSTWKEREMLKQQKIRNENPTMPKVDTAIYRNSYMHNLCVGMLKAGFHKSFDEMFCLIDQRKKDRLIAGVDSILWQEVSLEVQEEKLDQLMKYLTKAETAMRNGKWDEVYICRHMLAEYFLETKDIWLSDHFFKTALETTLNIRLDGGKREAEANCNMGLSYERSGDFEKAAQHMEIFRNLSVGRAWVGENDVIHSHTACRHLSRIYTTLAEKTPDGSPERTTRLRQAFEMAQEGNSPLQEAQAALRLGRNCEQTKDSEAAIEFLTKCLETAQVLEEERLIGEACEALARSYQTQGNTSRSLYFLEMFADSSRSGGFKEQLIEASNCLGTIYNIMGEYDKSVEHFTSAFNTSHEIQRHDDVSRVHLGIARGHQMLNAYKDNMGIPERYMMSRIVEWKDERINEFGKPLPEAPATPPVTPLRTPDPTQPFREADPRKV